LTRCAAEEEYALELPEELRAALNERLGPLPAHDLAEAARSLSLRYRDVAAHAGAAFLRSDLDVAAYAAYRLPATYAAIGAVLAEVRRRRPDLEPGSLLDLGAGPGTASWAAADLWPNLKRITCVERDPHMIDLGKALVSHAVVPSLGDALWRRADWRTAQLGDPADLAVAGYTLGEFSAPDQTDVVRRLWANTADTCVIVEPGTPAGFAVIRQATETLAQAGAHILAPFPPEWQCVEHERDWCHFSQRVPRTRLHRAAKGAELSFEDEKYSYVAASRHPGIPIAARVIRQPQVRSGHVRLVLCTAAGVIHIVVPRSQREAWRLAKDLVWGSAISTEHAALFGL
jgi:ribosomal protein RSM22 (predicted rRNA methylase)